MVILIARGRATTGVGKEGRGHNGGVWEWTSTVFDKYEGFVPSKLYPGYAIPSSAPRACLTRGRRRLRFSADFFDDCHNVVVSASFFRTCLDMVSLMRTTQLGGSYALFPRLSERRTLRNYFQRNYG